MDFIDQLQTLASKVQKAKDLVQTEEATKNAFVLPFIHALGYDVFDPTEVVPEFTADVGIKKGEKVDYAIFRDGKPIILFECKKCGMKLDFTCASQLYRYFTTTEPRIAVLTDGVNYQFYSDLDEPNKMDTKPFMEINILDLNESTVAELKKLTKSAFNLEAMMNAASELKYTKEIRRILAEEFNSPSDDLVKFFIPRISDRKVTQKATKEFQDIVRRALHQFVADRINERIKSMLTTDDTVAPSRTEEVVQVAAAEPDQEDREDRIVTHEEEIEGFHIAKSIVREVVDLERIFPRDTMSYFGILLDDNNRKPICRLHFNRSQKYIGLFDAQKNEERIAIDSLNDIYRYADRIKGTLAYYNSSEEPPAEVPSIVVEPQTEVVPSVATEPAAEVLPA
jgi:predicted type IV restriction endonuclease